MIILRFPCQNVLLFGTGNFYVPKLIKRMPYSKYMKWNTASDKQKNIHIWKENCEICRHIWTRLTSRYSKKGNKFKVNNTSVVLFK